MVSKHTHFLQSTRFQRSTERVLLTGRDTVARCTRRADLTRHILDDEGLLGPAWKMFRDGCTPDGITCLTVVGWIFTIVCTYSGFICLFVGVLWSADIHKKFAAAVRKNKARR